MFSFLVIVIFSVLSHPDQVSATHRNITKFSAKLARATYKDPDYDSNSIPVTDWSKAVEVQVGLGIRQIHDIDEFHQVMKVSVWQRTYWKDEYIQWDPSEFGGIQTVTVKESDIWTPDLVLYTNGHEEVKPIMEHPRASVDHEGHVSYFYPILFHVACEMDMR